MPWCIVEIKVKQTPSRNSPRPIADGGPTVYESCQPPQYPLDDPQRLVSVTQCILVRRKKTYQTSVFVVKLTLRCHDDYDTKSWRLVCPRSSKCLQQWQLESAPRNPCETLWQNQWYWRNVCMSSMLWVICWLILNTASILVWQKAAWCTMNLFNTLSQAWAILLKWQMNPILHRAVRCCSFFSLHIW